MALVRISVCCMSKQPSLDFVDSPKQQKNANRNNWKPADGVIDAFRDTPYPGVENYTQYAVDGLGLSPLPNAKPLIPNFGPVVNDVTSFRYHQLSIPSCREENARRNIFITVLSAAKNFEQRASIRETWAKDLNNVLNRTLTGFAGFAFVLGKAHNEETQIRIEEESNTHKDIIQIDVTDDYRNLPIKMVGLLNWWHKNCANFKGFFFKLGEFVYLNVRTLEYFIHSYDPFSPTMLGAIIRKFPARGKKLLFS